MCDSGDDMGVVLNGPRAFPLPMGVIESESRDAEQANTNRREMYRRRLASKNGMIVPAAANGPDADDRIEMPLD